MGFSHAFLVIMTGAAVMAGVLAILVMIDEAAINALQRRGL